MNWKQYIEDIFWKVSLSLLGPSPFGEGRVDVGDVLQDVTYH